MYKWNEKGSPCSEFPWRPIKLILTCDQEPPWWTDWRNHFLLKMKIYRKTMLLKNGKNQPGPLAPPLRSRPSLNITALSYSWTTCNDDCMTLIYIYIVFISTLKQTQRLKGRVKITMTQEMAVSNQPQRPIPVSTSSPANTMRFDLDKTRKKLTNVLNYQVPHLFRME